MSNINTVFLNKSDVKRANKFANERVAQNVSLYERRGGFKKVDIVAGAMAEIAVYKILKEGDVDVKKPDFTIHEVRQKSFDADLSDGIHNFHVKGQTLESKKMYGASWIMQRTDPIIQKPERLHYMVPCTVCTETGRVEVYGVFSLDTLIRSGCIGECANPWFAKTKVAIYLKDLDDCFSKKARWGSVKAIATRFLRMMGE